MVVTSNTTISFMLPEELHFASKFEKEHDITTSKGWKRYESDGILTFVQTQSYQTSFYDYDKLKESISSQYN